MAIWLAQNAQKQGYSREISAVDDMAISSPGYICRPYLCTVKRALTQHEEVLKEADGNGRPDGCQDL